jgi:hypothetical protein
MLVLCCLVLLAGLTVQAQDQKVMHCFTFTQMASATPADWTAFAKATDALPGQIPGLLSVIHGKLVRPMGILAYGDKVPAEVRAKARAGETVTAEVSSIQRQYGVCMTFASADALKAYGTHKAHEDWNKAYEKVRVYGTTTFDIVSSK